jgi:hypothetical protein
VAIAGVACRDVQDSAAALHYALDPNSHLTESGTDVEFHFARPAATRRIVCAEGGGVGINPGQPRDHFVMSLRKQESEGLGDLGIVISIDRGGCFVMNVREGSEAAAAGLYAGDEVLSIDGVGVNGRGMDCVRQVSEEVGQLPKGTEISWVFARSIAPDEIANYVDIFNNDASMQEEGVPPSSAAAGLTTVSEAVPGAEQEGTLTIQLADGSCYCYFAYTSLPQLCIHMFLYKFIVCFFTCDRC